MVSKEIVMKYLSVLQDITYKVRGCQETHQLCSLLDHFCRTRKSLVIVEYEQEILFTLLDGMVS